jgi:hypothetical protein
VAAAVTTGESMKACLLALTTAGLGFVLTGCGNDHHSYYSDGYAPVDSACPGAPTDKVQTVSIETGEMLTADPGQGAGVFVEYAAGGAYHVFSTCDTSTSGFDCQWAMIASIDPTLSLTFKDDGDLESDDSITRVDKGAVKLLFNSGADFDGAVLTVPPGEKLRLNVMLDGCYTSNLVSWISNGTTVQNGAPTDPVDFVPTSP